MSETKPLNIFVTSEQVITAYNKSWLDYQASKFMVGEHNTLFVIHNYFKWKFTMTNTNNILFVFSFVVRFVNFSSILCKQDDFLIFYDQSWHNILIILVTYTLRQHCLYNSKVLFTKLSTDGCWGKGLSHLAALWWEIFSAFLGAL